MKETLNIHALLPTNPGKLFYVWQFRRRSSPIWFRQRGCVYLICFTALTLIVVTYCVFLLQRLLTLQKKGMTFRTNFPKLFWLGKWQTKVLSIFFIFINWRLKNICILICRIHIITAFKKTCNFRDIWYIQSFFISETQTFKFIYFSE